MARSSRTGAAATALAQDESPIADILEWYEGLSPCEKYAVRPSMLERLQALGAPDPGRLLPEPRFGDALRVVSVGELLSLEIPPREYILEPILREKETAMLHAWRGVGKTFVSLAIAVAVASGGRCLRWAAPRPRKVLYIDGEMPAESMQARLAATIASEDMPDFPAENLRLVCADLQDRPLRSLATTEGQDDVEPYVANADLVIVDSVSTLASAGRENEAESWMPVQEWALALRRRGKTLLLLHHDGKGREQRGTSRREDVLDVVIHLTHPPDYDARDGARFAVALRKARNLHGKDAAAYEARLEVHNGRAVWTTRDLADAQLARAVALYGDGCSPADVAQELGVSRATAFRLRRKAKQDGQL